MTQWLSGLERYSPYALTLLRIMAGALLLQHGLSKLIGFPMPTVMPLASQLGIGAVIETVTSTLLILGLWTRPAAFFASGLTAVAFWQFHFPRGIYPAGNGGEVVALFCFIFFYISFAGPGALSVDGLLHTDLRGKKPA
jgi:putative oxidoreductase